VIGVARAAAAAHDSDSDSDSDSAATSAAQSAIHGPQCGLPMPWSRISLPSTATLSRRGWDCNAPGAPALADAPGPPPEGGQPRWAPARRSTTRAPARPSSATSTSSTPSPTDQPSPGRKKAPPSRPAYERAGRHPFLGGAHESEDCRVPRKAAGRRMSSAKTASNGTRRCASTCFAGERYEGTSSVSQPAEIGMTAAGKGRWNALLLATGNPHGKVLDLAHSDSRAAACASLRPDYNSGHVGDDVPRCGQGPVLGASRSR
jgi:hypothetical protein